MGSAASRTLLIALAEENNRSRRRKLFDFVSSLGRQIVPEVMRFLDDDRWFVVRNMLVLLRAVNDRTSLPRVHELARHPDLRVRLEAIKSLLTLEPSVPRTLLENAINDPDPKLAETAVGLVGTYGIREAIQPLVQIIRRRDYFGARRPLRLRVIRALADLGDPSALAGMEPLFSDSFWPWPAKEERRAAFQSLSRYPVGAREALVRKGLKSRDAAIRRICEQLSPVQEIGDQTIGLG
jgi:HEAT repeat protein